MMVAGQKFLKPTTKIEPPELTHKTTIDWRGVSIPLNSADVTDSHGGLRESISARDLFAARGLKIPDLASARAAAKSQQRADTRALLKPNALLAVLDPHSDVARIRPDTVRYLADIVRSETLAAVPRLRLLTRENELAIVQAAGRPDLGSCEGECDLQTARLLSADLLISGGLHDLDGQLKLVLNLHEVATGEILSSKTASGRSLDELDSSIRRVTPELLLPVH